ncbi:FAD:protein FMN transferase [Candidatus Azambacteria bacterium]|nr:FAD:protein FMN transferase [Candidatus Azambacteria bacterium]
MNSNTSTTRDTDRLAIIEKKFRAMGTDVIVAIVSADACAAHDDADDAERAVVDFEKRFSRFLPASELCSLNKSGGKVCRPSADMIVMLAAAQRWHEDTGGVFDPSVCEALEELGYDKSIDFEHGSVREETDQVFDADAHRRSFQTCPRFADMRIVIEEGTVAVPRGMKLDLGGIGKGYIVDAMAQLLRKKYRDFWISAGGDMFLSGYNSENKPWEIMVQNPLDLNNDIGRITMGDKKEMAVATSGVMKRKGVKGGFAWHHIIDPRTGLPASNTIAAVTVLAPTVTAADVCAKVVLILGEKEGIDFIDRRADCACLTVDMEGKISYSRTMKEYFVPVS